MKALWKAWFFQKRRIRKLGEQVKKNFCDPVKGTPNIFKPPQHRLDRYDCMEEHWQAGRALTAKNKEKAELHMSRCEQELVDCVLKFLYMMENR